MKIHSEEPGPSQKKGPDTLYSSQIWKCMLDCANDLMKNLEVRFFENMQHIAALDHEQTHTSINRDKPSSMLKGSLPESVLSVKDKVRHESLTLKRNV